jgi:glucose-1-phosphate thymidylyltransferase
MITKGIILAGGQSTRLYPVTHSVSKHLLPVYDKPMIYYPLTTLMLAGITDVLVITRPEELPLFHHVFRDGSQWGINIHYAVQKAARGLAEALIIGGHFIGNDPVAFILGDNIFYGEGLGPMLRTAAQRSLGANVFAYYVDDPQRYGVVELDGDGKALSIVEKPSDPKSSYAVTGLYLYDSQVRDIVKDIKPSARGELEITAVNARYLELGQLHAHLLGRGYAWFDTGTHESLLEAANFVAMIQRRQGLQVACPEEIAFRLKHIDEEALLRLAATYANTAYGKYLERLVRSDRRYLTS